MAYVNKNSARNCCTRSKSVRDLLAWRCLQSWPHYLQHFPEAANRKFMQKNYTANYAGDAIGNGLETVCGAGQMRRDKLRVRKERLFALFALRLTPFSSAWLWLKTNLSSRSSTLKVKASGTHQSYSHAQFWQLNMETSSEILSRHLTSWHLWLNFAASSAHLLLWWRWKVKAGS